MNELKLPASFYIADTVAAFSRNSTSFAAKSLTCAPWLTLAIHSSGITRSVPIEPKQAPARVARLTVQPPVSMLASTACL